MNPNRCAIDERMSTFAFERMVVPSDLQLSHLCLRSGEVDILSSTLRVFRFHGADTEAFGDTEIQKAAISEAKSCA